MSVRVHNAEYFEELRQIALSNGRSSPRHASMHSPFLSTSSSSASPSNRRRSTMASPSAAEMLLKETQMKRVAMKHELYVKEQEALQKKVAETIAENIQKQKTRKEAQYAKLQKDVDDAKALAEELHEKLQLQEQSKARQYQRMHDEWKVGVYEKLNGPILEKVQQMDARTLNASKHEAYQKFLNITNKKAGLFRDIIIESEYNPLQDVKYLKYRAPVDDPAKRVIRRREEEDAIAREGSNTNTNHLMDDAAVMSSSPGRNDNLDVKLWARGVFESTPYGYFHKMMNSKPTSESSKTFASSVTLDHYNIARGAEVVLAEQPKGKRTHFDPALVKVPQTTIRLS